MKKGLLFRQQDCSKEAIPCVIEPEGAVQIFRQLFGKDYILGAVGVPWNGKDSRYELRP